MHKMNDEDLIYFKNLLLEKREEILEDLRQYKNPDNENSSIAEISQEAGTAYHMADVGTDTMELEKKYYLAAFEGERLREIDDALERIKNGTYGHCTTCGANINRDRLEAIPHAQKCVACKASEEGAF